MSKIKKEETIASYKSLYDRSSTIVLCKYHGLTVAEMKKLRQALRSEGAGFQVIKNSLIKRSLKSDVADSDLKMFKGPISIAYSPDHLGVAKTLVKFAKEHNVLEIVGGIVQKKIVDASTIHDIASLPSMDEAKSRTVGMLQAPMASFVRLLLEYSKIK